MNNKHTSELLEELKVKLLKRRDHLWDLEEKLQDSEDEDSTKIMSGVYDELNRISIILLRFQTDKI